MDLSQQLRVPVGLDETWAALNDPERFGPVVPGVSVASVDGDAFDATMKIKLGPLALAFEGAGRYTARDAEAHRVVVTTQGTDRRGLGATEATHTVTLTPGSDGRSTEVDVHTELTVTGRPAQLGHGVLADAAERVAAQSASRIAARVSEGLPGFAEGARRDAAEEVVEHPVELGAELGDVDETAGPVGPSPSPRAQPSPPPEPGKYVYQPYSNTADPHVNTAKTLTRLLVTKVAPYAGLGGLVLFGVIKVARRSRSHS